MKNSLLLFAVIILFNACKTKEVVTPNRPPSAFTVTQTLKSDGKTIVLNWTKAKDPDGDVVTYAVVLNDTLVKNISDTTYTIASLDFNYSQVGKVIAKDAKGLTTEVSFTAATIVGNFASISDANFEKCLIYYKIDKDGVVNGRMNIDDAKGVKVLNVGFKNIENLVGIEFFIDLETLYCDSNKLINLDLSKNAVLQSLICSNNQLKNIDVSKNGALYNLNCANNQITNLDLSKNTVLKYFHCENNKLTSLDLSNNIALIELYCYSNSLTTLNMNKNIDVKTLWCYSNQLTSLDVSKNVALFQLDCKNNNKLTTLDVSKNVALEHLGCNDTQLTSLDLSKNIALITLECYSNKLISLDLSKNLKLIRLNCYSNQFTNLDISKNVDLIYLNCILNQIKIICVENVFKAINNTTTKDNIGRFYWQKDPTATYEVCK